MSLHNAIYQAIHEAIRYYDRRFSAIDAQLLSMNRVLGKTLEPSPKPKVESKILVRDREGWVYEVDRDSLRPYSLTGHSHLFVGYCDVYGDPVADNWGLEHEVAQPQRVQETTPASGQGLSSSARYRRE